MALKQTTKRKLTIISASLMCVFTACVAATSVLAWFSTNKNVNADRGHFSIAKVDSAVTAITVHDFYGSTQDGNEFGFNPTANHTITWDDHDGSDSGEFIMGSYSLNDPHHPVMFLFEVDGSNERITLKTDSTYLAKIEPAFTESVATYSALSTYAEGTMVEVAADETRHGCKSVYRYNGSEFELQWVDLLQDNNPLSSIINTHYVLFEDDPTDNQGNTKTKTGNLILDDVSQSRTYVPVQTSQLTNEKRASFVSFDNQGEPVFTSSINLFQGSTRGYTHLGIIIDYNIDSLEYLYAFFLGHRFLNAGLGFICDWSMEV